LKKKLDNDDDYSSFTISDAMSDNSDCNDFSFEVIIKTNAKRKRKDTSIKEQVQNGVAKRRKDNETQNEENGKEKLNNMSSIIDETNLQKRYRYQTWCFVWQSIIQSI